MHGMYVILNRRKLLATHSGRQQWPGEWAHVDFFISNSTTPSDPSDLYNFGARKSLLSVKYYKRKHLNINIGMTPWWEFSEG